MVKSEAKVQVKDGQGKVVSSQKYEKISFQGVELDKDGDPTGGDPKELLSEAIKFFQAKVGEKGNGVVEMLKYATYGYDLNVKANIRNSLMKAIDGPEKAIEKAAKDIMAARQAIGKPITMEQALVRARATLED